MRIGLLTLDEAGCLCLFNSVAEQILGYGAQDVCGKSTEQIFSGLKEMLEELHRKGRGEKREMRLKINARHKDGHELPLVATAHITPGCNGSQGGKREVILVFQDERELEQLESQLRHVNRLQSLDQFAAGIAHEIRNPLAGISTNAQHMKESIGRSERFYEEVQDILADVKNIEEITTRVLDFAHPGKAQIRAGPVEGIVEEVLRFSKMSLRRQGIRLVVNFDKSPAKVSADASQIKQVFFNIVRNACEAMPQGGELRVGTSRVRAGKGKGKGYVCVEVEDTGRGIAAEHLERIFDPFFSLQHEGTGLGLAISRKIVETHGGRIEVRSEPGKGTAFSIILPAV